MHYSLIDTIRIMEQKRAIPTTREIAHRAAFQISGQTVIIPVCIKH
jgi:hypothetical protein